MARPRRNIAIANDSAKQLHDMRKKAHLTQKKVADEVGICQSTISMYENGNRIPEPDIKDRLFDYYKRKKANL